MFESKGNEVLLELGQLDIKVEEYLKFSILLRRLGLPHILSYSEYIFSQ